MGERGSHGLQGKQRGVIRILQSLRGRLGKFYYDTTKILQPFPPPPLPRDKQCLTVISQITDVSLDSHTMTIILSLIWRSNFCFGCRSWERFVITRDQLRREHVIGDRQTVAKRGSGTWNVVRLAPHCLVSRDHRNTCLHCYWCDLNSFKGWRMSGKSKFLFII